MDIKELRDKLKAIAARGDDPETEHSDADDLLIEFINDDEVTDTFNSIHKYYA